MALFAHFMSNRSEKFLSPSIRVTDERHCVNNLSNIILATLIYPEVYFYVAIVECNICFLKKKRGAFYLLNFAQLNCRRMHARSIN